MKKKSKAKIRAQRKARSLAVAAKEVKPEPNFDVIDFEIEVEAWEGDPLFKVKHFAANCSLDCLKDIRLHLDSFYDAGYEEDEVFEDVVADHQEACPERQGTCPLPMNEFAAMLK